MSHTIEDKQDGWSLVVHYNSDFSGDAEVRFQHPNTGRAEFLFSPRFFALDGAHQDAVIAHEVGHVLADWAWNDATERGADRAAREFLGIEIKYDKAFPGKGLQTCRMTDNPDAGDTVEDFEAEATAWHRAKEERIAAIETLLEVSPALLSGRPPYASPRLAIVSGELSDTKYGPHRVTFFGTDGPHGHATRRTMREIAAEIEDTMGEPYESMTDADVIAWTSTPEFVQGAKTIAFVQADNTYRWLAQVAHIRSDEQHAVASKARTLADKDIEIATEFLLMKIRELPRQNPSHADLVPNPPWVTGALAQSYETLEKTVPPEWMPALSSVSARGGKLTARLTEFGCGAYGCVLPTLDAGVVLKVTTDATEATFAADIAPTLVAPICVEYHMVADLAARRDGQVISLLWRESAERVGADLGPYAERLIGDQHEAAQIAYEAVLRQRSETMIRARISHWLEMCERMASQTKDRDIAALGAGLVEVYERQRILFGDIHAGNLGVVTRDGKKMLVITDPGHVAVLDLE